MTVRAQCRDASASARCYDAAGTRSFENRNTHLEQHCVCASEQRYEYRWDEVNRLAEAARFDRNGSGPWRPAARQRYRYDSSNQRTVKATRDYAEADEPPERVALYVYPGDFERRGLRRGTGEPAYVVGGLDRAETQYQVGGARIVWQAGTPSFSELDRDHRITFALTDLIQSTSAVVDLVSGELLESTTFYPNGARETHRTTERTSVALEPLGFTGKEEDEEVGVVYFGERYLVPRLARWASPDPLEIHSMEGGETGNSFHYLGGNKLQDRDALGLQGGAPRYAKQPAPPIRPPALQANPAIGLPAEYVAYRSFYESLPEHLREMFHTPETFLRPYARPGRAGYRWQGPTSAESSISGAAKRTVVADQLESANALARVVSRFRSLFGPGGGSVREAKRSFSPEGPADWSHPVGHLAQRLQEQLRGYANSTSTMGASVEFRSTDVGSIEAKVFVSRSGGHDLTRGQRDFLDRTLGAGEWSFVKSQKGEHAEVALARHAEASGANVTVIGAGHLQCGACQSYELKETVTVRASPLRAESNEKSE